MKKARVLLAICQTLTIFKMARCFKLLKELPFIPAGSYYKMDFYGSNIYLSVSTNEYLIPRPGIPSSNISMYTLPADAINLKDWFEEVDHVPDHGDASTFFHGHNWYWTGPRFEYKDGFYWYCQRKCKEITVDKLPFGYPITEKIRDDYKMDTIGDYPAGSWEVFHIGTEYYVIGETLAGPKLLNVLFYD